MMEDRIAQRIECVECAPRWEGYSKIANTHRHPSEPEEYTLTIEGTVREGVPDNHGITVNDSFFPAHELICDSCGASLPPGSRAVAVTLGFGSGPPHDLMPWWESEYLIPPYGERKIYG